MLKQMSDLFTCCILIDILFSIVNIYEPAHETLVLIALSSNEWAYGHISLHCLHVKRLDVAKVLDLKHRWNRQRDNFKEIFAYFQ